MRTLNEQILLTAGMELMRDMLHLLAEAEAIYGPEQERWQAARTLTANSVLNWCQAVEQQSPSLDKIPEPILESVDNGKGKGKETNEAAAGEAGERTQGQTERETERALRRAQSRRNIAQAIQAKKEGSPQGEQGQESSAEARDSAPGAETD